MSQHHTLCQASGAATIQDGRHVFSWIHAHVHVVKGHLAASIQSVKSAEFWMLFVNYNTLSMNTFSMVRKDY